MPDDQPPQSSGWARRLADLGKSVEDELASAGRLTILLVKALDRAFLGPFRGERPRWGALVQQIGRAGSGTLPLVALISFLIGMILALQSAHQLQQLG
ncbi:MAG: ABC transporter permease, partial [Acidobacteriota bacterium]